MGQATTTPRFETCDAALRWPRVPQNGAGRVLALDAQFEDTQWLDEDVLQSLQLYQLQSLLAHARDNVEWYSGVLDDLPLDEAAPLTMEHWRKLPVLLRSHVQKADSRLHATHVPPPHARSVESTSSGSTGQPVTTIKSMVDQAFFLANNLRFFKWAGWDFSKTVANLAHTNARTKELAKTGRPTGWVPGHKSGPMYYFGVSRTTEEKIRWLEEINPAYLVIFPSALGDIIRVLDEQGKTFPNLRGIMSQSEMLDDRIRQACDEKFGVGFFEIYSSQENGVIAVQCPEHSHYHIMSESLMVEILDEQDQPCDIGETGRVIVTSLHNFNMPLIRYDTGDYAIRGEPCVCGRGLPVIRHICGRYRNLFVDPQGRRFWPTIGGTAKLFALGDFNQMQFIQHSVNALELKLVADQHLEPAQEASMKAQLVNHLWPDLVVTITYVSDIPRSPSGKFEDFICMIED